MNHHEAYEVVVEKQIFVIHTIGSGYDLLVLGYLVLTPLKHGMSRRRLGQKLSIYINTSVLAF